MFFSVLAIFALASADDDCYYTTDSGTYNFTAQYQLALEQGYTWSKANGDAWFLLTITVFAAQFF